MNLEIFADGDNCWPDLKDKPYTEGQLVSIARLPHGMVSGEASVTVRIELPDGQTVLAQTSLALFESAYYAFLGAAYRDDALPRFGGGSHV